MHRGVPDFLLWCAKHGIEIDERLELRVSPLDGSMSIFSRPDVSIAVGESLVRIPKCSVFSAKNCSRSRDLVACRREPEDPTLELSLAFHLETFVGPDSPWSDYFLSLPNVTVDITVFWGVIGSLDELEAKEWLKGTEAQKILFPPARNGLLDRINEYFENVANPVLRRLNLPCSLNDFYRAYSIVSSRAFLVDSYHGLSLVPVADAFNHVEDNHVHLESDYHVCPTCGSLDECEHDGEIPYQSAGIAYGGVDTCEMVANSPIGPCQEVFNTYEKGLTNAQLLCQYGFTLDVNENNLVTWSVDELIDDAAKAVKTVALWKHLMIEWPIHPDWDDLQLVYNSRSREEFEDGVPTRRTCLNSSLNLNADGQISHPLWLLLFALVSQDFDVGNNDRIGVAREVARAQAHLEVCLFTGVDPGPLTVKHRCTLNLVRHIAQTVLQICEDKIGSAHCAGMSASQIGDLLDAMPTERKLTRQAVSYALEERKTVQACHAGWTEVAEMCRERVSASYFAGFAIGAA